MKLIMGHEYNGKCFPIIMHGILVGLGLLKPEMWKCMNFTSLHNLSTLKVNPKKE
jgi:hypothetical protein